MNKTKKTQVKRVPPPKKVTTSSTTEQIESSSTFQHTSALLELAQQTDKKDSVSNHSIQFNWILESLHQIIVLIVSNLQAEKTTESSSGEKSTETAETNKMEESENQLVEGLDDEPESESGDNMIIISSSDDNKQIDETGEDDLGELPADDESNLGETPNEEVNDAKESGTEDNETAESSVVEVIEKAPEPELKKPLKKKDKEEEEGG